VSKLLRPLLVVAAVIAAISGISLVVNAIALAAGSGRPLPKSERVYVPHPDEAVYIVTPYVPGVPQMGAGTGFLVDHDRLGTFIVTNKHVCNILEGIVDAEYAELIQGERVYVGRIIARASYTDLCLIEPPPEIVKTRHAFKLADGWIAPTEQVFVHGHPFLRPLTMYSGKYVNLRFEPEDTESEEPRPAMAMARVDFMVFPGNSGSPVLNSFGKVIGVVFAYETQTRNGLFVPLSDLKRFIEQVGSAREQ
jgi:S1-C subfamily serine protease